MNRFPSLLLAAVLVLPGTAAAITLGQIDDFEDSTTRNWSHGPVSPNPPTNIPGGGPLGAGDNYLELFSTGNSGPGGKIVVYNQQQWSGNYVAAGVTRIQAMAANFGSTPLHLRVGVQGNNGTQYGSTTAVVLPADALWHPVTFSLGSASMTLLAGTGTLNGTLSDVNTLRILSRQSGPGWNGDQILGVFGLDNISAATQSAVGDAAYPAVRLLANSPNPFAASTRIRYELPRPARVRIEVFGLSGRRLRVLEAETPLSAGVHEAEWNGRDDDGNAAPAGIYYYRLSVNDVVRTGSMVLLRD